MKKFLISALATGLLLTACSPGDAESPTPVPSVSVVEPTPSPSPTASEEPSPTPSPEPSPDPTSTLSPEQQEAVETVLEFFEVHQQIRSDLDADFQPLADLTTEGPVRAFLVEEIAAHREAGLVQIGSVAVTIVSVDAAKEVNGERRVKVRACTDSSDSDVVDADTGESVLPQEREPHVFWALDVVHESDNRWRVTDGGNEVRDPCE